MPLELLGVPKQLFVVEELEEALVELSDVVPPVFRELYHHHDQVELPDGDEVRHDEGADGGGCPQALQQQRAAWEPQAVQEAC